MTVAALDGAGVAEHTSWRWWVLSSTSLASLLAALNTSTLVIALPDLIRQLHTTVFAATWTLLAYILAQSACVLTAGRLGDLWGRRPLYIAGIAGFTASALLSGFAPDAAVLIALRVLAGASGALVIASSSAIVTDAFPRRELGLALGINGMTIAVGSALGPVLGGWLVGFGWQWIFWFNVPLGVLCTAWAAAILREPRRARSAERLDIAGNLVFVATLCGLLVGLSMGGLEGWTHPAVIGGFAVFLVGLPLFLRMELRRENALLDLRLFRNRLFAVANLTQLVNGTARIGLLFLLVFYLQGPQQKDAVTAGVLTVPLAAVMVVASPGSGWLADRIGSRLPSSLGMALTGAGLLGIAAVIGIDTPYWELALLMTLVGLGAGIFQSPNAQAIMGSVRPEQRGVASGIRLLGSFIGVMLSIAFVLAIVTSSLPHEVTLRIFSGVTAGIDPAQLSGFMSGVRVALLSLGLLNLALVPVSLRRD